MVAKQHQADAVYPIRVVAEQTGVNPVTLRAWERRYGLIQPERTAKGHRLYSRRDIDTIDRILRLLDQGVMISRIKESLAAGPVQLDRPTHRPPLPEGYEESPWEVYVGRMATAVSDFDERALDAAYNDALSVYPLDLVTRMLILPLLREMSLRWETFTYADAEKHFLDNYLRNKLGARFHHQSQQASGPKLVLAGLPGAREETPLFMLALEALTAGYRVILLGADCQLESVQHVAARTRAAALVLHSELLLPTRMISYRLARLTRDVECPVFIGGACGASQEAELERAGLAPLPVDAVGALQVLRESLRS